MPSLVREIVKEWSYWLGRPDHRSESGEIDGSMMFTTVVPAEWIEEIIAIDPKNSLTLRKADILFKLISAGFAGPAVPNTTI